MRATMIAVVLAALCLFLVGCEVSAPEATILPTVALTLPPPTSTQIPTTPPSSAGTSASVAPTPTIKPTLTTSQLENLRQTIEADRSSWKELLRGYENIWGSSPVSPIDMSEDEGIIVISILCHDKVQPVSKIIRNRLATMGIPLEIVEFEGTEIARPDMLGWNHLEYCREPHPADGAIRAALEPHLCRCGAHPGVLRAARALAGEEPR